MDRRVQKTRDAIRKSYFNLLKNKEDEHISVAELTREANIDRKTFYLHYTCIDDVWSSFCDEKVEELRKRLQELGFIDNPIQMKLFFKVMNEVFEENKEELRVLTSHFFQSFYTRVHTILVQSLIEAYSDRVTVSEDEMKIYCDFFISGLMKLYQECLENPDKLKTDEIEEVIMHIALNGIIGLIKTE